jgi:hypothetical protein
MEQIKGKKDKKHEKLFTHSLILLLPPFANNFTLLLFQIYVAFILDL